MLLRDEFDTAREERQVDTPFDFCNPVAKTHQGVTPINNPNDHLEFYTLTDPPVEPERVVTVSNQFGEQTSPSAPLPSSPSPPRRARTRRPCPASTTSSATAPPDAPLMPPWTSRTSSSLTRASRY